MFDEHLKGRTPTTNPESSSCAIEYSSFFLFRARSCCCTYVTSVSRYFCCCYRINRRIMRSLFYSHISSHLLPLISFLPSSCYIIGLTWFGGCALLRPAIVCAPIRSSPALHYCFTLAFKMISLIRSLGIELRGRSVITDGLSCFPSFRISDDEYIIIHNQIGFVYQLN